MLSVLVLRFARSGGRPLDELHPDEWLVWEPGTWHVPRTQDTLVAAGGTSNAAAGGEALAIPLERTGPEVVLGRDPKAGIQINDATLSALHLALVPAAGGWSVRDLGSRNGTRVDGLKLAPQLLFPLKPGAQIEAGTVRLTYYSGEAMRERLTEAATQLKA
jgi:hypothetical protein